MQPGQLIRYNLKTSNGTKLHQSEIIRVISDPLKIHETKCLVEIAGEKYGIPISEITSVLPAPNSQLSLF